ncbi:hypothetical protein OIDMADRAFT_184949, partial [Oidiodendron maius Zn]
MAPKHSCDAPLANTPIPKRQKIPPFPASRSATSVEITALAPFSVQYWSKRQNLVSAELHVSPFKRGKLNLYYSIAPRAKWRSMRQYRNVRVYDEQYKNTPIEDTVGALAELVAEGAIGGIQLSEVGAATIRRATAVAKIDMVEEEVSLWAPEIFDNGVATTCAELGILIVAHTPLGAGMLAGKWKTADDVKGHHRAFPRFQGKNFDKNLELVSEVAKLAKAKGVTPGQLALSWIKAQSNKPGMPFIIPISGTR